ncbi:restriction endonuclease subunit S [Candidatus Methylospira mobilis]|uniref:restriction endonuclease subunit S n=1 Tax=Candidatus Methylospira mobilis TaxID=1808979 RepID=UPI0028E19A49|nr:restriction endonuclease subunit S [Candidatus Methylospira mobilis]WNV06567.1 restriction endonuclease subunit S [Candidatus Methylospira mobilis]
MNAELLLQHFDRISEAPDAIPRLRRFILDLAVRGKLVEQDPNDEPAEELLKRIQAEKARLIKLGDIKKEKSLTPILSDESPFEIPSSWKWVRIRHITSDRGQTIPKNDFTYIDVTAINKEAGCVADAKVIAATDAPSRARKLVHTGDVIYSCVRPYLLNIAIIENEIKPTPIVSTAFTVLNGFQLISSKYLWIILRSPFMVECVEAKMRGQAYPAINDTDFALLPCPLPPQAEQHRIATKVDELMTLCDQLEAAKNKRETRRDRLVKASLQRICVSEPEKTREAVRFHLDNLPRLSTRPEHIKQLRQTILDLAVRGRLVPQDPNDEPAATLPKRSGAIPTNNIAPFQIPDSWQWTTVEQTGENRLGKMLDKAKNKGSPRRYLRNINVRWFDFNLSDLYEMPFEDEELDQFALRHGDVLICEGGEPGRAAVWDERESSIYFQKAIHRVRFSGNVNPEFFVNVLRESSDSGRLSSYFTGVGIKHFTGKGLASFVFPLPPITEQQRIVAKVDELMTLCDQLDARLTTTESDSRRLLAAALHEALSPTMRLAA